MDVKTIKPVQKTMFGDETVQRSHRGDAVRPNTKAQRVLDLIVKAGLSGCTADELAEAFGWEPNMVGPRLAELRSWGHVRKTEARRDGKAVYIAVVTP